MVTEDPHEQAQGGPASGTDGAGADAAGDAVVASETTVAEMELVGGEVCLDFVNTGSSRTQPPFKEKLHDYDDLLTFALRTELLGEALAERLRASAAADPEGARRVLARARELREAIYRAFAQLEAGGRPAEADLATISAEASVAAAARRLVAGSVHCEYVWPDDDHLERPLWPIAASASDLATSERVERVKECAADNCNWLFYDASRNRSRRWCDMRDCGNRAKARRFRRRASDR